MLCKWEHTTNIEWLLFQVGWQGGNTLRLYCTVCIAMLESLSNFYFFVCVPTGEIHPICPVVRCPQDRKLWKDKILEALSEGRSSNGWHLFQWQLSTAPFRRSGISQADPPTQQGDLSSDPCWAGGWQVCVCSAMQSRHRQPAVFYEAVRWKWTACPFLSDCHPIRRTDGKLIPICLFFAERIECRWVSADTCPLTSASP